ncbi:MAG: PDZ domain-containing protein, partial [Acidobacteria bacterium]|nr:PDZ domain-containing protein [Acidobacteriota bacterium]
TWVDPRGPAAGQLRVTDILEEADAEEVPTVEHWRARSARFTEGQYVRLTVRRRGEVVEVHLTVAAIATQPEDRRLGLTLRTVRSVGAAIISIEPDSEAARSGLQTGDILTAVGDLEAPTAAQASRLFQTAPPDRPILIGFTRAGSHHVVALTRTW